MYEPNPTPDQAEAFQPIGGKPLALYAKDAAFLAKKGQAAPIMEPSPSRRKKLDKRIEGEDAIAEMVEDAPLVAPAELEAAPPAPALPEPASPIVADEKAVDELFELLADSMKAEPSSAKSRALQTTAPPAPVAQPAAVAPKASVSFEMTAPEFLRLSIAAELLGRDAQAIIAEAVGVYLDAQGVDRIDDLKRFLRAVENSG